MNQLVSARWGVSHVFSLLSTGRSLTHEQRLRFKKDGRPCPKVVLKDRSSESVYAAFPWICGDEEKNTYFCWPCLIMGDLSKVGGTVTLLSLLQLYLFFHIEFIFLIR